MELLIFSVLSLFLISLSLPLIISLPDQRVLVCLVVPCMQDISHHLPVLHFLRQMNQNKTQHLLYFHPRELPWGHDCISYLGVPGFLPFLIILNICSVFLLVCLRWALGWHHYSSILMPRSPSSFRAHHLHPNLAVLPLTVVTFRLATVNFICHFIVTLLSLYMRSLCNVCHQSPYYLK